jgi:hypothetical protein
LNFAGKLEVQQFISDGHEALLTRSALLGGRHESTIKEKERREIWQGKTKIGKKRRGPPPQ